MTFSLHARGINKDALIAALAIAVSESARAHQDGRIEAAAAGALAALPDAPARPGLVYYVSASGHVAMGATDTEYVSVTIGDTAARPGELPEPEVEVASAPLAVDESPAPAPEVAAPVDSPAPAAAEPFFIVGANVQESAFVMGETTVVPESTSIGSEPVGALDYVIDPSPGA